MTYQIARNRRTARVRDVSLVKAQVSTGTGAIAASVYELGDQSTLRLVLNATAVAGSGSVTVTVETSADGSTGWVAVAAFAAQSTVASQRKVFTGLDRFVRLNVTAQSGTSVTYDVTGESC